MNMDRENTKDMPGIAGDAAGCEGGFIAETRVYTKEGLKPIEEIRVGDWVLSHPDDHPRPFRIVEENGERRVIHQPEHEYAYRQVVRTFVQEDKPVCEVLVFDSGLNEIEYIKVTLEHPFYEKRKGWTPAGELGFGCMLLGPGSWNLPVGRVKFNGERSTVYNLEVDEFHTYYVGEFGVWVHYTGDLEDGFPQGVPCAP
jgi:hypothetical protein